MCKTVFCLLVVVEPPGLCIGEPGKAGEFKEGFGRDAGVDGTD